MNRRDSYVPNAALLAEIAALSAPALLARINAVRARLNYPPVSRHGAFYFYGKRESYDTGKPRAAIVEQCERLETEEHDILAEQAAHKIDTRFQQSDIYNIRRHGYSLRDESKHLARLKQIADLPRSIRMKALAFVGLSDADLAPETEDRARALRRLLVEMDTREPDVMLDVISQQLSLDDLDELNRRVP